VISLQRFLRAIGTRLRPLLRPDWEEERRTLAQMRAKVDELAALQEAASRHGAALAQLRERVEQLAARDVTHLRKSVTDLRRVVLGHSHMAVRALRQSAFFDEQAAHEHAIQRLVDRAKRTGRPVIAGPWTGEIGFELLYWIPFLRKLKPRLQDVPLHVLSRGGTAEWYAGIADGYQEIFTLVDPVEFRRHTDRETRKQRAIGAFDRRLLRDARRAIGAARPVVLHPSLMYGLLYAYWKDQLPMRRLFEYLEPARMAAGVDRLPGGLPQEYVAVRFYFSQCFPDTAANRAVVAEVVRGIAQRVPVVVLNMPFAVDDHVDAASHGPGIHTVAAPLTPETNLAVQTAVIRGARAFVGTYGGFSYLAPLCGVPSVTLYSEETFFEQHLEFARRTFSRVEAAPFVVLHERERALITDLLAPAPAPAR
jgi:hypothetical protein